MYKQPAFYFDASCCSGCKTCQVACKDKHNLPAGMLWRKVYEVSGGHWEQQGAAWQPRVFSYNISMSCNHCQDPVCMKSCPNKAINKNEEGVVLISQDRCMGCRYCEWNCPYGSLMYDPVNRVMTKCTMCYDYLTDGKFPSCVTACPLRAFDFGELEDLQSRYGTNAVIYPLASAELTKPALVVKSHRDEAMAAAYHGKVMNKEEVKYGSK